MKQFILRDRGTKPPLSPDHISPPNKTKQTQIETIKRKNIHFMPWRHLDG